MTVFEITTSAEYFSLIDSRMERRNPRREEIAATVFRGESLSSDWEPISCYKLDPDLPLGDFSPIDILGSLFVVFPKVLESEIVRSELEECELLEISVEGSVAHIVYVRDRFSALDRQKSKLVTNPRTGRETTNYPVFEISKIPSKGGLFRIEEAWNRVFLAEPEQGGIKQACEQLGITGMVFSEKETL